MYENGIAWMVGQANKTEEELASRVRDAGHRRALAEAGPGHRRQGLLARLAAPFRGDGAAAACCLGCCPA